MVSILDDADIIYCGKSDQAFGKKYGWNTSYVFSLYTMYDNIHIDRSHLNTFGIHLMCFRFVKSSFDLVICTQF